MPLLPENAEAGTVYMASRTQWRQGMGGTTGLDYPAVEAVMRMRHVTDSADCLARIQVLENETLAILRDKRGDQD